MSEARRCTKCLYWHTGDTCNAPPARLEFAVSVLAQDVGHAEKRASDLAAQLARRDGELEALRGEVLTEVIDALETHRANAERARGSQWAGSELWFLNDAMMTAFQTSIDAVCSLAVLSDNQESPTLTDKEA